ncbi:unnamed protein product [Rotaria sp. Silwood1]|nr:unnamed protein product [Rotaria sp. Silwood1]
MTTRQTSTGQTSTGQTSTALVDNVQKILSVYVPNLSRDSYNKLLASINIKSYGTITFSDNKSHQADFIRIPHNAPVMQVHEFLNRHWSEGHPSLVISITGGAKEYNMKPRLLRAFRRGLLKVARTTGAWIITGGMNTGIMKLVGEIVQINPDRSRPIPLIGIATWGCVSGRDDLDPIRGSSVSYTKPRSNTKGEAPLEPNHTKFIFVDDGSNNKYGREIAFRAKLEHAISGGFFSSKTTTNSSSQNASLCATQSFRSENSEPVPVVLLVVEGGPNTVRTVKEAVVENNIPAVFFEGTGRCCDLFAKAFRFYNKHRPQNEADNETLTNRDSTTSIKHYYDDDELKIRLREELKDDLRVISGSADTPIAADTKPHPDDKDDYFELVYECFHKRRHFLNVISLNSRYPVEPDIDLAILQALLNATSNSEDFKTSEKRKREQLRLALEWNRVDIARNVIMKNEADWRIDLNDLFLSALKRDQVAFVKLFLDHDFSLTVLFRNIDRLVDLYDHVVNHNNDSIKTDLDPLRALYEARIQPLIGDFFDVRAALSQKDLKPNADSKSEDDNERGGCCGRRRYNDVSGNNHGDRRRSQASILTPSHYMDVDRELFLWSVIAGRRDLALLFWSRGKNKIATALIATLIYKNHARTENDNSYTQWADEFENLAVEILEKFYQASPKACLKAIIRQIPGYGNATWLELAVAADAKDFISQRAVQDLFNDIWFGYVNERTTHVTIVFSTFMLWFSGFLRYNENLVTEDDNTIIHSSITKPSLERQSSKQKRMGDRKPFTFSQYFLNITTFLRAPYVKYLYNLYSHLIFLMLFSYVILCDFFPLYNFPVDVCGPSADSVHRKDPTTDNDDNEPLQSYTSTKNSYNVTKSVSYGIQRHKHQSITEIILVIWVFTLVCEEVRQLVAIEAQSTRNAIIAYFKTFWNRLDVLAIILFIIGITLRYLPTSECFCAALDVCGPSADSVHRKDPTTDNDDNEPLQSYTSTKHSYNVTKSVSYGFQRHKHQSITEIILVIWVFTLVCEEIRQLVAIEAQSTRNAVIAYFKTFWNRLDVLAIILFIIGITLRYLPASECFCAARIILSFDLSLWFIRTLDMFAAVRRLGPKLVMIGEMVHDLKFFMLMLFVFILAFGVPFHGLVHGVNKFSWHLPREIMNLAYWQIFGELEALDTFGDNYKANGYAAFILLISYMAIVSILLVNLLIAMFSNTFDRLQSNTDRIWKFQRYSLVCEYLSRPSIPAPFIFFSHLWRVTLFTLAKCPKLKFIQTKYEEHLNRTKYKISLDDKSVTKIEAAEDAYGDEVYYNFLKIGRKLIDETDLDEERVQSPQENILNKIRTLENRMQVMSNQQAHMCDYLEHLMDGLKVMGGERIKLPERRRLDPEESLLCIFSQSPQENILNKIRTLENRMQVMSNQQAHMCDYLEHLMDGLKVMGGERIKLPERRRLDPEESFDDTSNSISQSKGNYRRESLIINSPRSSITPDEPQTPIINTFSSPRNMSENSQTSTQSTNVNNNNSNPTSDTLSSSVPFTLKRWNLVGIWSWDVAHDVCAICRTALSESCLRCQAASNLQECIIVWGTCNHSFHNCCMSQWVKQRAQCPLCQTDWVINRIGQ